MLFLCLIQKHGSRSVSSDCRMSVSLFNGISRRIPVENASTAPTQKCRADTTCRVKQRGGKRHAEFNVAAPS
jgi:hypothetical protein